MAERKSRLTRSDCLDLYKKLAQAEGEILRFVANGCQETGLRDDIMVCVSLLDLQELIGKRVREPTK